MHAWIGGREQVSGSEGYRTGFECEMDKGGFEVLRTWRSATCSSTRPRTRRSCKDSYSGCLSEVDVSEDEDGHHQLSLQQEAHECEEVAKGHDLSHHGSLLRLHQVSTWTDVSERHSTLLCAT